MHAIDRISIYVEEVVEVIADEGDLQYCYMVDGGYAHVPTPLFRNEHALCGPGYCHIDSFWRDCTLNGSD